MSDIWLSVAFGEIYSILTTLRRVGVVPSVIARFFVTTSRVLQRWAAFGTCLGLVFWLLLLACHSSSCSPWWCKAYLSDHLRRDSWCPQDIPWERYSWFGYLHRTRQAKDCHRSRCVCHFQCSSLLICLSSHSVYALKRSGRTLYGFGAWSSSHSSLHCISVLLPYLLLATGQQDLRDSSNRKWSSS